MKEEISKYIQLGNTMDMQTAMGPVANEMQYKKVCSYIKLGKQEGWRSHHRWSIWWGRIVARSRRTSWRLLDRTNLIKGRQ